MQTQTAEHGDHMLPDGREADFLVGGEPVAATVLKAKGLWVSIDSSAKSCSPVMVELMQGTYEPDHTGRSVVIRVIYDLINQDLHFIMAASPEKERMEELVKLYGSEDNVPFEADGFLSRVYVLPIQNVIHELLHGLVGTTCAGSLMYPKESETHPAEGLAEAVEMFLKFCEARRESEQGDPTIHLWGVHFMDHLEKPLREKLGTYRATAPKA